MALTTVYVDGFNLYHGAKELVGRESPGASWKWLDIHALSKRFVPRDQIHRVRYFTARVASPDHDPSLQQRQQAYIRALETDPTTSIHYGQFKLRKVRMPLVRRPNAVQQRLLRAAGQSVKRHPDGNTTVQVWKTEEKGSDVNLASYLIADAFRGQFEKALIISNDTDLCEPIRLVSTELSLPIVVVNPRGHTQPAAALRKVASQTRRLRVAALVGSQFPELLNDAHGTINRPPGW